MRLVVVDAATGQARTAVEDVTRTFIDWTGKSFFQVLSGGNEAIWQSERSGWSHLERVDLRTGVRRPITQGNWVVRDIDRVDEEKRQIWFTAGGVHAGQDPYHVHFGRVNFDGTGLTWLTRANGQHRAQFSPDGEWLLATCSRADLPPVHELRRVSDGALVMELERADDSALRAAGWKTPIVFSAKGRDGVTDIWGLIYLPTTFDPAKKYAVVEDIYAGPHSAHVPKIWHVNSFGQQNAELGFIVVRIDGMGTSHRSKAFHDVAWQNIADAGFPDRIAWMKAAAKQVPQMDLSRIGIYGTSAGGQNALHAVLLHGDFYKLAVADCGCYDNRMDKIWWNEQWMGYPIGPHYEAQSGRTLAPRLKGDLMLVLGEEDTNVDPASTWQVVDALVQANKDFELVVLPNVGHGALGHPYAQRRFREFLVDRLIRGR
jgi:dipeptidyl aminopeptidase/acylaminoacyl peptidase